MRDALIETVRHNCNLADAQYAGNYTMCIYLLKMREFFRWEAGYQLSDALPKEALGQWLIDRESLWEALEEEDAYRSLEINGQTFDPFSVDEINSAIESHQLVYGAGIGPGGRPLFFLAELDRVETHGHYQLVVTGKELARDLTSPAAMAQGQTIYIRGESLRRMVWERVEQWRWSQPKNAMAQAIASYDFEADEMSALDAMTKVETSAAVLHEIGEVMVTDLFGDRWASLITSLPRSRAELMLRAIRDNLADSLSTLPELIETSSDASIHFYFGNLDGFRRELWPQLVSAYDAWVAQEDASLLRAAIEKGRTYWQDVINQVLVLCDKQTNPDSGEIEALVAGLALDT